MRNGTPVIVRQLPQRLDRQEAQVFMRQIEPLFEHDQPRLVLDFSQVRCLDSAGVDMLLKCLQEVMKRDGDLKLAAVSPQSAVILELTRLDRLFEIFQNTTDAIESFYTFPVPALGAGQAEQSLGSISGFGGSEDFKAAS